METETGRGKPGQGPSRSSRRAIAVLFTALAVLALAASALAAHPTKGGHYKGRTTQHKKISFVVSKSGKKLVGVHADVNQSCKPADKASIGYGPHHPGIPVHVHSSVRSSGRFSFKAVFPRHRFYRRHHYVYTASGTLVFSGRFVSPNSATGTMKGTSRTYSPFREACSGSTSFTVARG